MRVSGRWSLIARAWWELAVFDLISGTLGFRAVYRRMGRKPGSERTRQASLEPIICEAIESAGSLYWKRILCLQRAVVTARLLRRYCADAEVVIGYRPAPFLSHAWVELEGRVINESTVYQRRLHVLTRL